MSSALRSTYLYTVILSEMEEINEFVGLWDSLHIYEMQNTYIRSRLLNFFDMDDKKRKEKLSMFFDTLASTHDLRLLLEELHTLVYMGLGMPCDATSPTSQLRYAQVFCDYLLEMGFFPEFFNLLVRLVSMDQAVVSEHLTSLLTVIYCFTLFHREKPIMYRLITVSDFRYKFPFVFQIFHILSNMLDNLWVPIRMLLKLVQVSLSIVFDHHGSIDEFENDINCLDDFTEPTEPPVFIVDHFLQEIEFQFPKGERENIPSIKRIHKSLSDMKETGSAYTRTFKEDDGTPCALKRNDFLNSFFKFLLPNISRYIVIFYRVFLSGAPKAGHLTRAPFFDIKRKESNGNPWMVAEIFPPAMVHNNPNVELSESQMLSQFGEYLHKHAAIESQRNANDFIELVFERQRQIILRTTFSVVMLMTEIFKFTIRPQYELMRFLLKDLKGVLLVSKFLNQDLTMFLKNPLIDSSNTLSVRKENHVVDWLTHLVFPPVNLTFALVRQKIFGSAIPKTPDKIVIPELKIDPSGLKTTDATLDLVEEELMTAHGKEEVHRAKLLATASKETSQMSIFDRPPARSRMKSCVSDVDIKSMHTLISALRLLNTLTSQHPPQFPLNPDIPVPQRGERYYIVQSKLHNVLAVLLSVISHPATDTYSAKILRRCLVEAGRQFCNRNPHILTTMFKTISLNYLDTSFHFTSSDPDFINAELIQKRKKVLLSNFEQWRLQNFAGWWKHGLYASDSNRHGGIDNIHEFVRSKDPLSLARFRNAQKLK
ncbi:hypothetical protein PCE1_001677 [Barthelona sp. PCE]